MRRGHRCESPDADVPRPPLRVPRIPRPLERTTPSDVIQAENRTSPPSPESKDVISGADLSRRSREPQILLVEGRPVVVDGLMAEPDPGREDPVEPVWRDRHTTIFQDQVG